MRNKAQSGFWYGVGTVLRLVPPIPRRVSIFYRGRDLQRVSVSESIQADWNAVLQDMTSANKAYCSESSTRQTRITGQTADDQRLATAK